MVELPITNGLTIGDLKYCDNISLVIRSEVAEALIGEAGVFKGSKGLGEDAGANITGETGARLFLRESKSLLSFTLET